MTSKNTDNFRDAFPLNIIDDTQELQKNIIAAAKNVEQDVERSSVGTRSVARFFDFLSQPAFVGMAASVALIAVGFSLWLPEVDNGQGPTIANTQSQFLYEELSLQELGFEELMLLEDELMFANL